MVKGLFREDILEYPEIFLREAVINALGHRDYSPLARGTAVQIKIFPNRIDIASPGGLFGPVTVERLGESGLQATRNSYLMKLLEDSPVPQEGKVLCENRGTGIPSMIDALRKAGMEPPQFMNSMTQFKVVCFNQALFDKETFQLVTTLRRMMGLRTPEEGITALIDKLPKTKNNKEFLESLRKG